MEPYGLQPAGKVLLKSDDISQLTVHQHPLQCNKKQFPFICSDMFVTSPCACNIIEQGERKQHCVGGRDCFITAD